VAKTISDNIRDESDDSDDEGAARHKKRYRALSDDEDEDDDGIQVIRSAKKSPRGEETSKHAPQMPLRTPPAATPVSKIQPSSKRQPPVEEEEEEEEREKSPVHKGKRKTANEDAPLETQPTKDPKRLKGGDKRKEEEKEKAEEPKKGGPAKNKEELVPSSRTRASATQAPKEKEKEKEKPEKKAPLPKAAAAPKVEEHEEEEEDLEEPEVGLLLALVAFFPSQHAAIMTIRSTADQGERAERTEAPG